MKRSWSVQRMDAVGGIAAKVYETRTMSTMHSQNTFEAAISAQTTLLLAHLYLLRVQGQLIEWSLIRQRWWRHPASSALHLPCVCAGCAAFDAYVLQTKAGEKPARAE